MKIKLFFIIMLFIVSTCSCNNQSSTQPAEPGVQSTADQTTNDPAVTAGMSAGLKTMVRNGALPTAINTNHGTTTYTY